MTIETLLYSKINDSERLMFRSNNMLDAICYSHTNNKACSCDAFTLSIGDVSKTALRSPTLAIHVPKTIVRISD